MAPCFCQFHSLLASTRRGTKDRNGRGVRERIRLAPATLAGLARVWLGRGGMGGQGSRGLRILRDRSRFRMHFLTLFNFIFYADFCRGYADYLVGYVMLCERFI